MEGHEYLSPEDFGILFTVLGKNGRNKTVSSSESAIVHSLRPIHSLPVPPARETPLFARIAGEKRHMPQQDCARHASKRQRCYRVAHFTKKITFDNTKRGRQSGAGNRHASNTVAIGARGAKKRTLVSERYGRALHTQARRPDKLDDCFDENRAPEDDATMFEINMCREQFVRLAAYMNYMKVCLRHRLGTFCESLRSVQTIHDNGGGNGEIGHTGKCVSNERKEEKRVRYERDIFPVASAIAANSARDNQTSCNDAIRSRESTVQQILHTKRATSPHTTEKCEFSMHAILCNIKTLLSSLDQCCVQTMARLNSFSGELDENTNGLVEMGDAQTYNVCCWQMHTTADLASTLCCIMEATGRIAYAAVRLSNLCAIDESV